MKLCIRIAKRTHVAAQALARAYVVVPRSRNPTGFTFCARICLHRCSKASRALIALRLFCNLIVLSGKALLARSGTHLTSIKSRWTRITYLHLSPWRGPAGFTQGACFLSRIVPELTDKTVDAGGRARGRARRLRERRRGAAHLPAAARLAPRAERPGARVRQGRVPPRLARAGGGDAAAPRAAGP